MRVLRWLGILLSFAAIFWVCTYKIMDRDFWWHITAGSIMLQTHHIIHIDPFAYTRVGQPYFANYEWLAQIILSLIYGNFGPVGVILFRGCIACATMTLLLLASPRRFFPNILLAVWAVVITKGSWLERPQLFTFVLFASFLLLALRFLDADTMKGRLRICAAFVFLELLWMNLHGGAALLGCAIVSFLFLQSAADALPRAQRREHRKTAILLAVTLGLMAVVFVLPPNGIGTLRYLWNLLHDQTILYIAEFQPRTWHQYFVDQWPFWLLALFALLRERKHWIFNTFLLLMTAYLSRQAFRNEIFFVLSAIATFFYQFDGSDLWDRAGEWMARRKITAALVMVAVIVFLGHVAYVRSMNFERPDNLFGFGQFDLARGGYDFLESEHIAGNMFNTYGIGGYLIHRGYPDRKVFIDGRNVDYGMDFMTHAYASGINGDEWNALVARYDINYAIIDYDAIKQKNRIPYSVILDRNPAWSLVYLDDWTAVYLKNTAANQPIINRWHYTLLTPTDITFKDGFENVPADQTPSLIEQLQHMRHDNPEGVKATLSLAKIALREKRIDDAMQLAQDVMHIRHFAPEPYAILAGAYLSREQWKQAADAYEKLLQFAGDLYPDINYGFIADVYEKAGYSWKAWWLRHLTHTTVAMPSSGTGNSLSKPPPSLAVNPASDAQTFNDQGVTQAQEQKFTEAEQSFLDALRLNPSFAEAWNNLCALRLSQGRSTDAVDACEHAIQSNASFADAHFNLALAYYHEGSLQKSKQEALLAKKFGRVKESDQLLLLIAKKNP